MGRSSASCCKARTLGPAHPVAIVLYRASRGNASDEVAGNNIILFKLVKAVVGHAIVAAEHERLHTTQRLAHASNPYSAAAAS